MQRLITRNPFESDKRVDLNWLLREESVCDYCLHKKSKNCDFCYYGKRKTPF